MSKVNNGGPAFPALEEHGLNCSSFGMTLRDYFAAKAMQALISEDHQFNVAHSGVAKATAELAYDYADAMLAAREAA